MIKKITITVLAASLCMLSVRCIKSDGELGDSTVVINLGLDQAFNAPKTRFDRFMNFIMPKAYAAPSNIASVSIVVSAEDIKTFENSYSPPPTYITVTVPAGKSRFIQVIGYVKDGDPSAVLSYRGTLTADLEPGETKEVAMQMVTYETKLVIPDNKNFRVVQIDDMTGKNWSTRSGSDISYPGGTFYPFDIDFDAIGRIYIVVDDSSANPDLIRIDNISKTSYTAIDANQNFLKAIAINRTSGVIYYATNSQLYSCDTNGVGKISTYTMTGISNIYGLAVDNEGMLFIACGTSNKIVKYNPFGNGAVIATYSANLNNGWDVAVKDDAVYVTNKSGSNGFRIIQLDKDLRFVKGYGSSLASGAAPTKGKFYGPDRIVAKSNRRLYVEDEQGDYDAALLGFDNIDGDNWQSFGSQGTGTNKFKFYYTC